MRSRWIALTASAAALAFVSGQANAEPPFIGSCGVVRAFTAPTANGPGSITIGSRTLALTVTDRLPGTIPGTLVCTRGGTLTSGPITVVEPMPAPLCGRVESITAAAGGTSFLQLQVVGDDPSYRLALAVNGTLPPFIAASIDRGVSGCFATGLDASGNVVVMSLIGGGAAPIAPNPSTPSTPPVRQLPSTSTSR